MCGSAVESVVNVVNGAAVNIAVLALNTGLLSEYSFRVNGGHGEKGDNPHPEDGTGAACKNGTACAYNISRADLRGDCGCKSLKGTHTAFVTVTHQGEVAENFAHTLFEAADLHKACLHGIPYAHCKQQDNQDVIRQIRIDGLYNSQHNFILPVRQKSGTALTTAPDKTSGTAF